MLFFPSPPQKRGRTTWVARGSEIGEETECREMAPDPQPGFLNSNLSQGKQDLNTLSLGNRSELAPAVEEAGAPFKGSSGDNGHRLLQEEGIN